MTKSKWLNIACGDVYVSEGWLNFDYSPESKNVKQADLLERLPLESESIDVIYSSHFIEHIPKDRVVAFVAECFRVLKPGGYLRFVLPDLEEMCRTYLNMRSQGKHDKANFLILEMLDQCVRTESGGELGKYYDSLLSSPELNADAAAFVMQRTGYHVGANVGQGTSRWKKIYKNPRVILNKILRVYIGLVVKLLPAAFRRQNVSFASIGERHAWLYDFYTIERVLLQAGFSDVHRMNADTSTIPDFPFYPLDIYKDGSPRKGEESMYIEARKP